MVSNNCFVKFKGYTAKDDERSTKCASNSTASLLFSRDQVALLDVAHSRGGLRLWVLGVTHTSHVLRTV